MRARRCIFATVGLAGCLMLGLVAPGCGGGLLQVTAREAPPGERPNLPWITVERLRQCVAEFGTQLEPGHYRFSPHVRLDQGGFRDVSTDDIPRTAPDLAICTRLVLHDMAIHDSILGAQPSGEVAATDPSYMGSPAAAGAFVLVLIAVGEVVFEAGVYTIAFAVAVETGKEIAEAARRRWDKKCLDHYEACVETPVSNDPGNQWRETRCGNCREVCQRNHTWPPAVGNGSCEYWKKNWGPGSN